MLSLGLLRSDLILGRNFLMSNLKSSVIFEIEAAGDPIQAKLLYLSRTSFYSGRLSSVSHAGAKLPFVTVVVDDDHLASIKAISSGTLEDIEIPSGMKREIFFSNWVRGGAK
jgi:hypothetical protein